MKSFPTGSRVYGEPNENSDLDLVVFIEEEDFGLVKDFHTVMGYAARGSGGTKFPNSLFFGNLNVILVTKQWEYDAWKTGTEKLKKMAPVTKEVACAMFDSLGLGKERNNGKCRCDSRDLVHFGCRCGGS